MRRYAGVVAFYLGLIFGTFLYLVSLNVEAGSKCDEYYEGYRDGWCSTQTYGCIEPGWYPVCMESDFNTEREAYHVGFRDGEKERGRMR